MADGGASDGDGQHGPAPAADPAWAGWQSWIGDRFEDHAGPFYFRKEADGQVRCAFRAAPHHMNGSGNMHGGCIMTFADYALFMIGHDTMLDGGGVTISLSGEFVGPVALGDLVEASGEVTRAGGSLVFIRGLIHVGASAVMSFSGVVKRRRR